MRRKKFFIALFMATCLTVGLTGAVGCSFLGDSSSTTDNTNKTTSSNYNSEIYSVYKSYVAYAESQDSYVLSYEEWLDSIRGQDGKDGTNGVDGIDGINGINGKDGQDGKDGRDGQDGQDGQDGKDGQDGERGADGKSAYDIAVDHGFEGDEEAWLESLKGSGTSDSDHTHIYEGVQTGKICDPTGYVTFSCECGNSYIVKNYQSHLFIDNICVYCSIENSHNIEGYTYSTSIISGEDDSITGNVEVELVAVDENDEETIVATTISDENGYYHFDNVVTRTYIIRFILVNYKTVEYTINVDGDISKDIYLDIDQSSILYGKVTIADNDTDFSNNLSLEGATVTLSKETGTNIYSQTVTTGANGTYQFDTLVVGVYKLVVEKEGYIILEQYVTVNQGANEISNIALEVIKETEPDVEVEKGTASGVILDAARQGNVGISDLKLEVRSGMNNITGIIIIIVYTTQGGSYTITGLDAGNYTVRVVDERELTNEEERYGSTYFNIKIMDGQTISQQNGSVSNGVVSGQMRIVLEWGATPSDLDSHLTGPSSSGSSRFHVYYSSMSYGYVSLDRDDTSSYGPETITITDYNNGVYRYSVYNFSSGGDSSSTALSNSGATVKVYFGDTLYATYYVPTNQAGTVWTVFEYDSTTGVITTINTINSNYSAM